MGIEKPSGKAETICLLIDLYVQNHGCSPSVRDIAAGLSTRHTTPVHYHLKKLKEAGYVTWEPNKQRTLALTAAGKKLTQRWWLNLIA